MIKPSRKKILSCSGSPPKRPERGLSPLEEMVAEEARRRDAVGEPIGRLRAPSHALGISQHYSGSPAFPDPQGADAKTSIGWSCRTPCSIELSLDGPFTVTFTRPGFAPRTVPVELEPGQPGEAHAKFAPNPPVRLPPGRPRLSTSELVPTTTIVAVLINPINNPAVVETVSRQAQASARALGLQILQEIACFQASYQLAGSSTRPRSTKLCRQLGCSGSSSPSFGRRRSRVAIAISPSIRASWAPRQK